VEIIIKKYGFIIALLFAFYLKPDAQVTEKKDRIAELEAMIPSERLEKARNWFITTDKNSDGIISIEEFPENIMHLWPLANINSDNYLTWSEELEYQRIGHEQTVLLEMSKVDRLCNIQHFLDEGVLPDENKIQDVSGEWLLFSTMSGKGNPGNGIMYINLTQNNTELEGELQQIKVPHDENITYRLDKNGRIKGKYDATLNGEIIVAPGENVRHNMIILRRKNLDDNFQAIFTGSVSADCKSMIGQLTNNMGHYGTMLMIRREELMQY
jgi:hypothetical protein